MVVGTQRYLHVGAMGQSSHASDGVFRRNGLERERVQSYGRRQGAIRRGLFVSGDFFNVLRIPALTA